MCFVIKIIVITSDWRPWIFHFADAKYLVCPKLVQINVSILIHISLNDLILSELLVRVLINGGNLIFFAILLVLFILLRQVLLATVVACHPYEVRCVQILSLWP